MEKDLCGLPRSMASYGARNTLTLKLWLCNNLKASSHRVDGHELGFHSSFHGILGNRDERFIVVKKIDCSLSSLKHYVKVEG